jgi:hypothetical protein
MPERRRRPEGAAGDAWRLAATAAVVVALAACSKPPAPTNPSVHTTKAFDAVFGALPPIPLQAPANASVVYFPAANDPGTLVAAPIFTTEPGKEEFLAVRTAVRGIDQEEFAKEVALPFAKGTDLVSFQRAKGTATVRIGGTFRAGRMSKEEADLAAASLLQTVEQFGDVTMLEISDAEGKTVFRGRPAGARQADPGNPRALGLLAIQEEKGKPATALSVLFDRPVFVEDIAFYPADGGSAYPGKAYATGFGMSVEFHPAGGITFDTKTAYRIRFKVHDGKGRALDGEVRLLPKEVVRI